MGENAERVQTYLAEGLSESVSDADWETEYGVGVTPVDVAGETDDGLVLVELEWRRADPADNAAKLFRHVSGSEATTAERNVHVFQVFTRYYDLAWGGFSSKRKNAEFVGDIASESLDGFDYAALTLDLNPPKRGGTLRDGWRSEVDETAAEIEERLNE